MFWENFKGGFVDVVGVGGWQLGQLVGLAVFLLPVLALVVGVIWAVR